MRISIVTVGSRGDVQPYLTLGLALERAGFDVSIYGPPNFQSWAEGLGLTYYAGEADYSQTLASEDLRKVLEGDLVKLALIWRSTVAPLMDDALKVAQRAAETADAVIYDIKVIGAADVAEATGVPTICAGIYPVTTATAAFPGPSFPLFQMLLARNLGGVINKASYLAQRFQRILFLRQIQRWRRDSLGLPIGPRFPLMAENKHGRLPRLHFVSRHVVPEPDDWDKDVANTGFLFLDDPSPTPAPTGEFKQFLDAGPKPLYVGFGSMALANTRGFTDMVFEALERSGARAVIEEGWGGLEPREIPSNVYSIKNVPHSDLLAHVDAMVHHGGCGTVAAGLRAGKPAFIAPFSFAQPWWGRRLHQMGLGPAPIPAKSLTAKKLAEKIDRIATDIGFRSRVEEVAGRLRGEDGAGQAVMAIQKYLGV